MAWIESHQALLNHRKTIKAARLLGIDRYKLIGHLHALWWWALDNVEPDGDISDVGEDVLEDAAGWTDGGFVQVLTEVGLIKAGALNDWYDYGGKLQERRLVDRDRKRAVRRTSNGHPQEVSRTQQHTTADNTTEEKITEQQPRAAIFGLFEQHFGTITGQMSERLLDAEREYAWECVEHCVSAALENGARSWTYVEKILERHKREGCEPPKKRTRIQGNGLPAGYSQAPIVATQEEIDWISRRYENWQKRKQSA